MASNAQKPILHITFPPGSVPATGTGNTIGRRSLLLTMANWLWVVVPLLLFWSLYWMVVFFTPSAPSPAPNPTRAAIKAMKAAPPAYTMTAEELGRAFDRVDTQDDFNQLQARYDGKVVVIKGTLLHLDDNTLTLQGPICFGEFVHNTEAHLLGTPPLPALHTGDTVTVKGWVDINSLFPLQKVVLEEALVLGRRKR